MDSGRHHDSALCHMATALFTRVIACWRDGEHYALRDTDGRVSPHAGGSPTPALVVGPECEVVVLRLRMQRRREGISGGGPA